LFHNLISRFEDGVADELEESEEEENETNDENNQGNGIIKSTPKNKKTEAVIPLAEMKNVKDLFEKGLVDEKPVERRGLRAFTPPPDGSNCTELENEPMQRSADIVSVYEKTQDVMPGEGYTRSRKELFSGGTTTDDNSTKSPPRCKSITPLRDDISKRVLKEITPERNDNVVRESDKQDDALPSVGSAKQKAEIFLNSRQKSIEKSGITIEGELLEKGIAKSRLAMFNEKTNEQSIVSNNELDLEAVKNASGIAKDRMNLFKNLEQQSTRQPSPSKDGTKKHFKEITPPPQWDQQQRQYIIIVRFF
jgi:hypothetical protein